LRSARRQPEAVRYVPAALPEAWFVREAFLLRGDRPAAGRQAAAYPRRGLPGAGLARFEPAALPEPACLPAVAPAWCPPGAAAPRESARSSAGVQPVLRSAQPAASAAPVLVRPLAASAVRYAPREAAAEELRAWAAAVVRQPAAAVVLRAEAAAAGQPAEAVALPREAAGAERLGVGAAEAEVPRAGAAAVRQPAVAAPRDVGRQRAARQAPALPWVFHPDQVLPWPARPPSGRFVRAMKLPRIALPSALSWRAAQGEGVS
jgi:hypothetical protein